MGCLLLGVTAASISSVSAEDLKQPYELASDQNTHLLETSLKIKKLPTYFEGWKKIKQDDGSKCYERETQSAVLRMYGYPNPRDGSAHACSSDYCYGFPGPTYRLRRANGATPGDAYHLTLHNELPVGSDDVCNIDGTPYTWDTMPNCFHGEDVTNHHFHGFHVSPNPNEDNTYQDYVYVKLYPQGSSETPNFPDVQVGQAVYELDPLTEGQHEGTHWYHPHKHGSTAQQLGNGMAGTFIIEGPYDDWIEQQVCRNIQTGCELKEQVLVVQEILSNFGFVSSPGGDDPPYPGNPTNSERLVNSQLYPTVNIAPGEVQRWRVLSAAMKAQSAFHMIFPSALEVRQIGMDGVPFVKENYERQPLIGLWVPSDTSNPCQIPPDGSSIQGDGARCILLHPGNRADFLVQRKMVARRALRAMSASDLEVGAEATVHRREFFSQRTRERIEKPKALLPPVPRPRGLPADTPQCPQGGVYPEKPGLFRINACVQASPHCVPNLMDLPDVATYPALPALADIQTVTRNREIIYQMAGYTGATFPTTSDMSTAQTNLIKEINSTVGNCQYLMPQFTIDGRQFAAGINYTMALGTSEQWEFVNQAVPPTIPAGAPECPGLSDYLTDSNCPGGATPCLTGTVDNGSGVQVPVIMALPTPAAIQHPVHIHVNPFQVTTCLDGRKCGPPYVWQDVMGLHLPGEAAGNATMRTTFETFTGEFVMHCHILGHEDRGMMQNLCVNGGDDCTE